MGCEDLIAARATRQEKEVAKEAARGANNEEEQAQHRNGTEAEPGIFGAEAQTDENMLGGVPFQAPIARMY